MKKKGFSLTEILLSVLIIGVVSSITIPTVTKNHKFRTYAKKLAVVKADVETALSSMIATEGVNDLSETTFGRFYISSASASEIDFINNQILLANSLPKGHAITGFAIDPIEDYEAQEAVGPNKTAALNQFRRHFKVEEVGSINDLYNNNQEFAFPFNLISGDAISVADTGSFRLKNGAFLIYESGFVERDNISSIGKMYIDVNGSSTPNTIGRDIFVFRVGNDGILYPAGGRTYSILETDVDTHLWATDNRTDYGCNNNAMGLGCTARLIENGYNVDF